MPPQFVIMTIYTRPTGVKVRHAFGTYATRSKARAALQRMLREHALHHGETDLASIEAHVTQMVAIE